VPNMHSNRFWQSDKGFELAQLQTSLKHSLYEQSSTGRCWYNYS